MYILYREDGKVLAKNLTDYIQKGNNNVNSIFIAIENKTSAEWSVDAVFTLPDGTPVSYAPTQTTASINGVEYSGWNVSIKASVTVYEGLVQLSLVFKNLNEDALFTFQTALVINPSTVVPDETTITYAQYQALLDLINQKSSKVYKHFIKASNASGDSYVDFVFYSTSATPINTELALRNLGELASIGMVFHPTDNPPIGVAVSRFFSVYQDNYMILFALEEYATHAITITTVTDTVSSI